MKTFIATVMLFITVSYAGLAGNTAPYLNNRAPLVPKTYLELPLGSIEARGWLLEMLERQRSGATGHMDTLYPDVMGERNGWLGGDGDQWERGPYWIDGLLPLAYILDDEQLKDKVRPWVEWALASQREDGYFGPATYYPAEYGLQRNNSGDWWPRMVVLKILQQHYSATGDERVVGFMTRYFRYQLATLPSTPLDRWTFWARYRACDNMQAVYWLYNITGDRFLLDLGDLLHAQGHDFTGMFLESDAMSTFNSIHCVNLAQGLKEPVVYYQHRNDRKYLDAVKKGLADIRRFNGQPQGMYGGDEGLHGANPTQGSELCSAVELMYSLETMTAITGDVFFADHLERVAFNALPTQVTDDFMYKQYFQQPNQVMATRHTHNFYEDHSHSGTDIVFGTLTGFPCCYSNMHQGWPKFTQNLWYATADGGVAALVYCPSQVTLTVGSGARVTITEEAYYPMDGRITFTVRMEKTERFPFHLRIPGWCNGAVVKVNGEVADNPAAASIAVLHREWKNGDKVELDLPMEIAVSRWYENSVAIERGPLVYALKMEEEWTRKEFEGEEVKQFGKEYYEVTSPTDWNYGIVAFDLNNPGEHCQVVVDREKIAGTYPWNLAGAPITIRVKAKRLPHWKVYNEVAGPLPYSISRPDTPVEEIEIIPYGCTTLRVSEFPLVR